MRYLAAILILGAALVGLIIPGAGDAQRAKVHDVECSMCHDGSDKDVPNVQPSSLAHSVHEGFDCVDCHQDVTEVPHPEHLQRVRCGSCHEDEAATYTQHGRGVTAETTDLPGCADCHGTHDIRHSSDPEALINPLNQPRTCGRCHQNLNLVEKYQILQQEPATQYESSVHGKALLAGKKAPTCVDCHSRDGTAHNILASGNPQSTVQHFAIPETCGKCHGDIAKQYFEGIHGQLAQRGRTDVPVCSDCHGEHGILPPDDPRSSVSPVRLAEATCEPCHESARLNEAFGKKERGPVSFVDSYHGLKSEKGDATVANCASCHEAHRILPSSDPGSSINQANLQQTCGACHPGITRDLAQTRIHGDLRARGPWADLVASIYTVLIVVVIGGMFAYVTVDFWRLAATVRKGPQVRRMDRNAVFQHNLLQVSFLALVITGFALRYSDFWLFRGLFAWDGGAHTRGIIHRIAGVLLIAGSVWHLVYLFTRPGRGFLKGMAPRVQDMFEFVHMAMYNVGLRKKPPNLGRFSFVEKAEYWALIWGTVVMAGTGLLLWFDHFAAAVASKTFLDVMRVIHLYEAWLAFLAILVWHLYHVLFRPGVYPGNPAWVTGTMPRHLHEHEHPADTEPRDEVALEPVEHETPSEEHEHAGEVR